MTAHGLAARVEELEAEVAWLRDLVRRITGDDEQPFAGLTRQQTRIVRALARAGGRVVSHEALLTVMTWDSCGDSVFITTLRTQICNIRRRRPDIGARLRTHHGCGYSLMPEGGE